jgi:DNA-binding transcriptional ArsR family regulator
VHVQDAYDKVQSLLGAVVHARREVLKMEEKQILEAINDESRPTSIMFLHQFLDEYGLDPYEFRVYSHVVRRTGGKTQGEFFASLNKTSEICQISVRKIQYALKFLYEAGFLNQDKRKGRTDVYRLSPAEDWVNKEDLVAIRARVAGVEAKKKKSSPSKDSSDEIIRQLKEKLYHDDEKKELVEEIERVIAIHKQKLHQNLLRLLLDTPTQGVRDALEVLKSQKGRLSNPSGLLTKAIKKSWLPQSNI